MPENTECPKWCVTDRALDGQQHIHRTQRTVVDLFESGTHAHVSTCGGSFGKDEIAVHSFHMTADSNPVHGDLYVPLGDASRLAGVFEALSYVAPDQIRELASAVRQAEAEMTAEPEAGA
jgi:hypothetical protein